MAMLLYSWIEDVGPASGGNTIVELDTFYTTCRDFERLSNIFDHMATTPPPAKIPRAPLKLLMCLTHPDRVWRLLICFPIHRSQISALQATEFDIFYDLRRLSNLVYTQSATNLLLRQPHNITLILCSQTALLTGLCMYVTRACFRQTALFKAFQSHLTRWQTTPPLCQDPHITVVNVSDAPSVGQGMLMLQLGNMYPLISNYQCAQINDKIQLLAANL